MLPDILQDDLDVVFCGTAAGRKSAEVQQYYAHSGNSFWKILYETGFTKVTCPPKIGPDFELVIWHNLG